MSLYLDTNIILPLAVVEVSSLLIRDWLDAQNEQLFVGLLTIAELGSAVSRLRRMDELDDRQAALALTTLDEWIDAAATVVDHEPRDLVDAGRFVRRPLPKLLAPDAIHLATCRRLGHRLVTNDGDLIEVADLLAIEWVRPG